MGIKTAAAKSMWNLSTMLWNYAYGTGPSSKSLTQLSKQTMVTSITYVDDTLINEDIAVPLMGALNQIYICYVLTALNIYNSVERYKFVQNTVGRLANEEIDPSSFINPVELIQNQFGKHQISEEAYESAKVFDVDSSVKHLSVGRLIEFDFDTSEVEISETFVNENRDEMGDTHKVTTANKSQRDTKTKPGTVRVPIYVQMKPVLMPSKVAESIIKLNFTNLMSRRWKMVKAGEIKFFRDFVLGLDQAAQLKEALKADSTNVLFNFYFKKNKNMAKHSMKLVSNPKQGFNNAASSTLIFNKTVFDEACSASGLDFSKPTTRMKFFDESYAIMVVVVDTMYDMVDIYYNGIPSVSEIPFKSIARVGVSSTGADLTDIMKAISRGSSPKF